MSTIENVELTVLCLVYDGDKYLLQDRIKKDWQGLTLPGGHVEKDESIVDAIIREMKEETGLNIKNPKLCGVKQFPIENGRYIVFLFKTKEFEGELVSSDEGQMVWVDKKEIHKRKIVEDFDKLIEVMINENLNEFQYIIQNNEWKAILK